MKPTLILAVSILVLGLTPVAAAAKSFIVFDAPKATEGTFPTTINANGDVAGTAQPTCFSPPSRDKLPSNSCTFGFLRTSAGVISKFKVEKDETGIFVGKINISDQIAGSDLRSEIGIECFVREVSGNFATLGPTTECNSLNDNETAVGVWIDDGGTHGLIFDDTGAHSFDAPGAVSTEALDVNNKGFVTGQWGDASGNTHGFLRNPQASITNFDVPGAVETFPVAISARKSIAGTYNDGNTEHSFLRTADGQFTEFDPAGAASSEAMSINNKDVVVGFWVDQASVRHGYFRKRDGTIVSFDVPRADDTFPTAINDTGAITGSFSRDSKTHGFVRLP